jgi:hypothetical membrane protein
VTGRWRGLDRLAACAGIAGAATITLGSIATAVVYRGADGESFSPLNHFVSELGELANAELARIFNLSLIVGGVCFGVFMTGLAASRPGKLRVLAGAIGVAAGLGGSFVGVFPMDYLAQHSVAAMTFFNLGWIAVGLASIDFVIHRDPRFPRWLAAVGIATVAAFIGFLREVGANTTASGRLASPEIRPDVWAITTLEWLTIAGIVGWVFLVGVSWLRTDAQASTERPAFVSTDGLPAERPIERPQFQTTTDARSVLSMERPAFDVADEHDADGRNERPAFHRPTRSHG